MRHADPSLTANVYTDPRLLDVTGALDALPSLSLDNGSAPKRARVTGTESPSPFSVALPVALTDGNGTTLEGSVAKRKPSPRIQSERLGLSQVRNLSALRAS